jgi:hypothetical protein
MNLIIVTETLNIPSDEQLFDTLADHRLPRDLAMVQADLAGYEGRGWDGHVWNIPLSETGRRAYREAWEES